MSCPDNHELMNYILGFKQELPLREHLARCKRCQKNMQKLDQELQNEALQLQEQSRGFDLRPKAGQKKAV